MPLHPATVSDDEKLLICSTHPATVCSEVTEWHKVWMGKRLLKEQSASGKGEKAAVEYTMKVTWFSFLYVLLYNMYSLLQVY